MSSVPSRGEKKKNKKFDMAEFEAALEDGGVAAEKDGEDAWLGSNRYYTYGEVRLQLLNVAVRRKLRQGVLLKTTSIPTTKVQNNEH
ncbi:hypothetical protein HKX48_006136 [Thoreauomyces humboldtii]|nr:hypothetical protein HKX48_006136 [Thoreauomyces humboldtii]